MIQLLCNCSISFDSYTSVKKFNCFITISLLSKFLYFVLCRCSTGANPVTDPTTIGLVAKVIGSWAKGRENAESVIKSPTGWYSYRQVVMAITTRCRVRDIFWHGQSSEVV